MTLLSTKVNRDLGNAAFPRKSAAYLQSEFSMTGELARHYDEWTTDKIESRQQWMAKQAIAIWRL
jgi:hypothetical protein